MTGSHIRQRISELGLTLPSVAEPQGDYVPAVQTGNYVFTAGQIPLRDGVVVATGQLGADVSLEDGAELARLCALNAVAAVASVVELDRIVRIVKVVGFVASAPGFTAQPTVINGASTLLGEIFGDRGRHARSAVGVSQLPLGVPVEIELIAEISQ